MTSKLFCDDGSMAPGKKVALCKLRSLSEHGLALKRRFPKFTGQFLSDPEVRQGSDCEFLERPNTSIFCFCETIPKMGFMLFLIFLCFYHNTEL